MLVWLLERLENSSPAAAVTVAALPPPPCVTRSTWHSVETLVVVVAVITMAAVIAGVFARACGGRHLSGGSDRDVEGWVERKCSSCLDSGIPPPPPPPPPSKPGEAKK
ncbi:hypothetical protein Cni_G01110 [Canna indica]|uniref:Uncharacterized protein n=1 Tax=Canna indica TaxID=4628 RepID=A0AAQ3JLZ4_9LILI|nr:hypothetical protein Cni_G01110 [Canna indica]